MGRKIALFGLMVGLSLIFSACTYLQKPARSGLQVITTDQPSSVFLDGEYLDKSPLIEKQLRPGLYQLKIEPDNPELVPYDTTINLRPGILTVVLWKSGKRSEQSGGVIYELEPIASKKNAEVSITTIPDGAIVQLENNERDFSPVLYQNIAPGNYTFEATLPSFEAQKHTVSLIAGYRLVINVKLGRLSEFSEEEQSKNNSSPTLTGDNQEVLSDTSPSATPSASPTASPTSLANATSSASLVGKPHVLILTTNFFQEGKEVLRVRKEPNSASSMLGFAEVGKTYAYLTATESSWHKIKFGQEEGWVSGEFSEVRQSPHHSLVVFSLLYKRSMIKLVEK
jgi:hypothetical protein